MAKAKNTFLGSKMNKDIDARILQNGDYRDALNVQISRSEGDGVGSLENVLGNSLAVDFTAITGISNLTCIGYCADDINNTIYLFLTNYTDPSPTNLTYSSTAKNFIYAYNTVTEVPTKLVEGPFLNFSKTHFIYATNVLEDLLFWTDNRNQPRKINITSALGSSSFYTTEDQISVSTYNPYQTIQLYRQSLLTGNTEAYETTMLDVTSKFYPNGGEAKVTTAGTYNSGVSIPINTFQGNVYIGSKVNLGANPTVTKITGNPPTAIELSLGITTTADDEEIIFEPNPYYDASYNGDPNYLEDKFVRFGYRFNYVDGENSIFSPFTQPAFIPKQDGYFVTDNTKLSASPATATGDVYVSREKNDQDLAYQSTIVEFMENKVNKILLYIPLPFNNYDLQNALKIDSIDILYKESNQTSVKVIEQVSIETIFNSAAQAQANGAVSNNTQFAINNIQGGIQIGAQVTGGGITTPITVTAFDPTDPNNPVAGNITVSANVTLADDAIITIGNPKFYIYDYQSRKPFKVLPEADLIRVYDKTPVRSLAQEVISNRVVYGNFQNKHTPPAFIDYNVNASPKAVFNINFGDADVSTGITNGKTITVAPKGFGASTFWSSSNVVGSTLNSFSSGVTIPNGTLVTAFNFSTGVLSVNNNITIAASDTIELSPASGIQDTSSIIEYPNHSLKQNRNYQVGVVLSDRFGRQSSVILSNSLNIVSIGSINFKGSTIYSDYNVESVEQANWPGDSLKVSFNSPIGPPNKNISKGWPGLYNGDPDSNAYNPLGWYSWKIVVKQTEQEYYNVYLPGIMASYPNDIVKELGRTSHTVLINDNINKIPRDLNEVGPQQKQFRSSVGIFGRVTNDVTAPATPAVNDSKNKPYFPGIKPDTVSTISTLNDLFDFSPLVSERPDFFPQFYSFTSDPLIARITTENEIGQTANTEFLTASAIVDVDNTPTSSAPADHNKVSLFNIKGDIVTDSAAPVGTPAGDGMLVRGGSLPEGTRVFAKSGDVISLIDAAGNPVIVGSAPSSYNGSALEAPAVNIFSKGDVLTFFANPEVTRTSPVFTPPGIQYLAVYETEPVESLLDIFWETSSTGLIEDLNNAILSDNLSAAVLFGFNDANFNEGITVGSRVGNTTTGFTATDIFGAILDPADFEITLESPFDGEPAITDFAGNDRTSDFTLTALTGANAGYYQLLTASLFVHLADPNIRNFNINFKITSLVDGTSAYFVETAELGNLVPTFINPPLTTNYDLINIDPNGSTTAPITPAVIMSQLSTVAISKLVGENGSRFYDDGTTGAGGTKFNAGRELIFELVAQTSAFFFFNQPYTQQQYIDNFDTGFGLLGVDIPGPVFTMSQAIATSNTTPDGIVDGESFLTLEKPDTTVPDFNFIDNSNISSPFRNSEYEDYIVWLRVTDAGNSVTSLSETIGSTTSSPTTPLVVRVTRANFEKGLSWKFITPRDLNFTNYVIDSTCTVATVPNSTTFTTTNLTGDNVFYGLFGNVAGDGGPIFCFSNAGTQANTDQMYQLNGITNSFFYPPNALILNSASVSTNVRVSNVDYTGTQNGSDFGSDATVSTFTAHGLNVGDQIKFTSGRWAVTMPNVAGTNFTANVFPRVKLESVFPFYSPTNPTQQASPAELCAQVTNAVPQKSPFPSDNCAFQEQPVEVNNVAPANPFVNISLAQVATGAGTLGSGTISGCPEDCNG